MNIKIILKELINYIVSGIIMFVIVALGYIRHSGNIKRLMNGTERKIGQKKKEEQNG